MAKEELLKSVENINKVSIFPITHLWLSREDFKEIFGEGYLDKTEVSKTPVGEYGTCVNFQYIYAYRGDGCFFYSCEVSPNIWLK